MKTSALTVGISFYAKIFMKFKYISAVTFIHYKYLFNNIQTISDQCLCNDFLAS